MGAGIATESLLEDQLDVTASFLPSQATAQLPEQRLLLPSLIPGQDCVAHTCNWDLK